MLRKYKCLDNVEFALGDYKLVSIRDEDKYDIMRWRNEQIDILRQKEPLTTKQQQDYFKNVVDRLFETEKPDQLLFSFLERGRLIGYGGLVHIDWVSRNGEISFLSETSRNVTTGQFKKDWATYLTLLKRLTQLELKFIKIYTYAYDIRLLLIETLVENEFREEARLRKHIYITEKLHDVLIHSYFFDDLKVRPATEDDMMMYFEWANDADVRGNSFNQEQIPLELHKKWFAAKIANETSNLFVVELNKIPVGQIRFEQLTDNRFEIGFSVDSNYRGRNFGTRILELGSRELLRQRPATNEIIGKVKTVNLASMNTFVKAGFSIKENVNGVITYYKINRTIN